ncbi:MAG: ABC transporter permease [Clostridia bacterium]|nr:ABC transporter permease [Clostridia bacterium]
MQNEKAKSAAITKKTHEPFIYITKRNDLPRLKAWGIRAAVLLIAMLFCALLVMLLTGENPINVFSSMVEGSFGTSRKMWNLLQSAAILLGISLAVTPAFKMRFWNTGAEGQVLIGMLASVACMFYIGDAIPSWLLIVIMFFASVIAGAVWAGIPGFFKATWNTNETLFTLMMNYVAMQLVSFFIMIWVPSGSMILGVVNADSQNGWFPSIAGQKYLLNVLIVALITVIVYVYLKKTKQGYEIAVVGESENTARYIGINVKKVILRTVLISGALCGVMGWILAAGTAHSITANSVGGNGFTAIMISWMSKFNPLVMVFSSLLVCFLQRGAGEIASTLRLNSSVGEVLTGVIILFIISSEFFINYKVNFRHKKHKEEVK